MSDYLLGKLDEAIEAGNAILLCGAGVSMAACPGRARGWKGLIESAIDRCVQLARIADPDDWATRQRTTLASGKITDLLAVAQIVSKELGGPKGGDWDGWLRAEFQELKATEPAIVDALYDRGVPIATLNYDSVIESDAHLRPLTWRASNRWLPVIRDDDDAVLHLHGHWDDPASVVLGISSYEKLKQEDLGQHLLQAFTSLRTLVFVGCGATFEDPKFSALLAWMSKNLSSAAHRHFLLVRDCERAAEQAKYTAETRVSVLGYGAKHEDLVSFLSRRARFPRRSRRSRLVWPQPPKPDRYVGREVETASLVRTLLANRPKPVAVLGQWGIGKSTMTLAALDDAQIKARFPNRRTFVSLEAVSTVKHGDEIMAAIARSVGMIPGPDVRAAVRRELERAPALVVLDNAETPWWATPGPAEALKDLVGIDGLVLVVSIRGDQRLRNIDWDESVEVLRLPRPADQDLFLAIARTIVSSDPLLPNMLDALDGVPLAIELVALEAEGDTSLRRVWTAWIQQDHGAFARGITRRDSVPASIEVSLASPRMSDAAHRLFALMGKLPDGVVDKDLDALLPGEGSNAGAVLRRIGLAYTRNERLKLLAPVREHAAGKHPPRPEDVDRAAAHYAKKLGKEGRLYTQTGEGHAALLQLFDLERGNVEGGWKWSKDVVASPNADRSRTRAAANALTRYFVFAGDLLRDRFPAIEMRQEWYQACLDAARHAYVKRRFAEADALGNIGICYRMLAVSSPDEAVKSRNFDKAVENHRDALAMANQIDSKLQQIYWLGNLARDYIRLVEMGRSKDLLGEALRLLESRITICKQEAERLEKIRQKLEASDPHYKRKTGIIYARYLGNAYVDKGLALQRLGNGMQARSWLNKGIKYLEEVNDRPALIFAYENLARLEEQEECYDEALRNFREMETVANECGRDEDSAKALSCIACVLWGLREVDAANAAEAISKARQAAGRFRSLGDNENAKKEDDRAANWESSFAVPGARL